MTDYHVHHHINVMTSPDGNPAIVTAEVFPHIVVSEHTETSMIENPDGSTTHVYTEAFIDIDEARALAKRFPENPIIILSHGHDDTYEERIALVLHGENGRLDVNSVTTGPIDDVIAQAMGEEDLGLAAFSARSKNPYSSLD